MMNLKNILAVAIIMAGALTSCKNFGKTNDAVCTCPPVEQIFIQPYNSFTEAEAEKVARELEATAEKDGCILAVSVLPPVKLGDEFKNDAGTRFRADKILRNMDKNRTDIPVVGLIHDDISCTHNGIADWGVLGLSYLGKDVCVVSTYRVKQRKHFWKVVYHEFGHAHYGLPHCPNDDPTCIMKDAKGHPNLAVQTRICDTCWETLAH